MLIAEGLTKPFYLAGPMSNIPQFNFPRFLEVAGILRNLGYEILNPAEMDSPEVTAKAMASKDGAPDPDGPTWGDFLARDVKRVADESRGVIMLDNWEQSKGARLECFVAMQCGFDVYEYIGDREPGLLILVNHQHCMDLIHKAVITDRYETFGNRYKGRMASGYPDLEWQKNWAGEEYRLQDFWKEDQQ
jgi:hypothetical protein